MENKTVLRNNSWIQLEEQNSAEWKRARASVEILHATASIGLLQRGNKAMSSDLTMQLFTLVRLRYRNLSYRIARQTLKEEKGNSSVLTHCFTGIDDRLFVKELSSPFPMYFRKKI
jgi:hypothetical protein